MTPLNVQESLFGKLPIHWTNLNVNSWSPYKLSYIITQVILAFWLVLAYDLLEDRRTIDVIISKFFPLCFEMAESFENLDNVLHDWAKDKVQKSLVQALNRNEKHGLAGRRKINQKKYSSSLSRQSSKTKPNTINLFKTLNFSQSQNNCWHSDCLE